jgi:hypothetical protein
VLDCADVHVEARGWFTRSRPSGMLRSGICP